MSDGGDANFKGDSQPPAAQQADSLKSHWQNVQSSIDGVRHLISKFAEVLGENSKLLDIDDLTNGEKKNDESSENERSNIDVNEKDDFLCSLPQSGLIQLLNAEKIRHSHAIKLLEKYQRQYNFLAERSALCVNVIEGQARRITELSAAFEKLSSAANSHHGTSRNVIDSLTQKLMEQCQIMDAIQKSAKMAERQVFELQQALGDARNHLAQCQNDNGMLREQNQELSRKLDEESRAKHESEIQLQRTKSSLLEMQKNHSSFLSEMEGFEQKLTLRESQLEKLREDNRTFERNIEKLTEKHRGEVESLRAYMHESAKRDHQYEIEQLHMQYADQMEQMKTRLQESEAGRQTAETNLKQLNESLQQAHMHNVANLQAQLTHKVNELLTDMASGVPQSTDPITNFVNTITEMPAAYSQFQAPEYTASAAAENEQFPNSTEYADGNSIADEFLHQLRFANVLHTPRDDLGTDATASEDAAAMRKAQLQGYLKVMVENKYGGLGTNSSSAGANDFGIKADSSQQNNAYHTYGHHPTDPNR